MITALFAGLLVFVQIWLSFDVIKLRRSLKVSIGDGGHDDLARRIRIHGNFTETVPIALIVMGLAELSGAPFGLLYIMGSLLLIGRIIHRYGIITKDAPMLFRVGGMAMTITSMGIGALTCIWLYITLAL